MLKRILSFFLSLGILCGMLSTLSTVGFAQDILTQEEIAEKNYPLPTGYSVQTVMETYDTSVPAVVSNMFGELSLNTDTANAFDSGSYKMVFKQSNREYSIAGSTKRTFDGDGIMFWYKSAKSFTYRLRNQSGSIVNYATLPANPDGGWVIIYYYGKTQGFTYNTSSSKTDISEIAADGSTQFTLNLMSDGGISSSDETTWPTIYIDELFTFKADLTVNDIYSNGEFFKFSLAKLKTESQTSAQYSDDGSVILTSDYGSTAAQTPINITYDLDSTAAAAAVSLAQSDLGYLKLTMDKISCSASDSDTPQWLKLTISIVGTDSSGQEISKQFTRLVQENEEHEILLNVSDFPDPFTMQTINFKCDASSSSTRPKNVQIELSAITLFEKPANALFYQAEDLDPVYCSKAPNGETVSALENRISYSDDGMDTYINMPNTTDAGYLEFTIPNLTAGEYTLYAYTFDTTGSGKFVITVNNLNPIYDYSFANPVSAYSSNGKNILHTIGTITVTRNGDAKLKFSNVPKCSQSVKFDWFYLIKTADAEPENPENYAILEYPAMEQYEVKTVLDTYDNYLFGFDERYYQDIQVFGYKGDGNAFNLNSRGTINKQYFDNNVLVSGSAGFLDGDGIRFWYKTASGGAILQFRIGSTVKYSLNLSSNPNGGWVTIYYSDVVANGDLSDITNVALKTSSNGAFYVDEFHTIQQQIGDVIYSLNGDGTASVTGYNLRLEHVTIASEYQGCPVVSIADNALKDSKTLKSVVIPSNVTYIGKNAFENCLNLTTVEFGGVTTIDEHAFKNCEKLTDVVFPSGLQTVASNAFDECDALVLEVTNDSFAKSYAIDNGIDYRCTTTDGFYYYRDYDASTDTSGVRIIGYTGTATAITVPSTIDGYPVVAIDESAFANNTNITSLSVPASVTAIGDAAFSGCTALTNVTLNAVTTIGNDAFNGCTALSTITLGNAVTTIGDGAFSGCSAIDTLYLPDSITSIGSGAFSGCDFTAQMSEATYASKTGYVYTYVNDNSFPYIPTVSGDYQVRVVKYKAEIIDYTGTGTQLTIPAVIDSYDVLSIGVGAFKNNTAITSVTFAGNVRTIDEQAFYGCSSLSSVTLEESLRNINGYAFAYCTALKTIAINDIVAVSSTAFAGCDIDITYIQTDFIRDAMDYVAGMTAGWNLGNTLDSYDNEYSYGDLTPIQSETLWGAAQVTPELMELVAQKFNTIRIPITWQAFIDPNNNYKIDEDFMDRVEEIVGYCYDAGFEYIIINVHHDQWLNLDTSKYDFDQVNAQFKAVWEQIADRFKGYDEKLIFEAMNEERAGEDWYGQTPEIFTNFNTLHQTFYDVVRSSGGNNDRRYLMMQTYAAQFSNHCMDPMWIPSAEEDDHIIASVHMYNTSMSVGTYTPNLQRIYNKFVAKGIPCVIGETGMTSGYRDGEFYDGNTDEACAAWATLFLGLCDQYQFKAIFWEDHGSYTMTNRYSDPPSWYTPLYAQAIYDATNPETPEAPLASFSGCDESITDIVADAQGNVVLPSGTISGKQMVGWTDGVSVYPVGASIKITEDTAFIAVGLGISTMDGASVRLLTPTGLRFETQIDKTDYDALTALGLSVQTGTIIVPHDYLDDGTILTLASLQESGKLYLDVQNSGWYNAQTAQTDGYYQYFATIANIKTANYPRDFVSTGYLKVTYQDGTECYFYGSDGTNTIRAVSQVAAAALADPNGNYTDEERQILQGYIVDAEAVQRKKNTYLLEETH